MAQSAFCTPPRFKRIQYHAERSRRGKIGAMQFLTISRRRTESFSDAQFAALMEDEFQQGRALYASESLRHIWRRGDLPGACILWEAESEAEVREWLNTLPLMKAGMLEVTVIPLKPYPGFGPRT